jgi:hypothetical protein
MAFGYLVDILYWACLLGCPSWKWTEMMLLRIICTFPVVLQFLMLAPLGRVQLVLVDVGKREVWYKVFADRQ